MDGAKTVENEDDRKWMWRLSVQSILTYQMKSITWLMNRKLKLYSRNSRSIWEKSEEQVIRKQPTIWLTDGREYKSVWAPQKFNVLNTQLLHRWKFWWGRSNNTSISIPLPIRLITLLRYCYISYEMRRKLVNNQVDELLVRSKLRCRKDNLRRRITKGGNLSLNHNQQKMIAIGKRSGVLLFARYWNWI